MTLWIKNVNLLVYQSPLLNKFDIFILKKMLHKLLCEKQRKLIIWLNYTKAKMLTLVLKPNIYLSLKEDKSIDVDIFNMYKHLSVSIWPRSQITEINLCFITSTCKPFISICWPIFVSKDNYNSYYYKNFLNVTSPSKCLLFLQTSPTPQKKQTNRKTD